MIENITDHPIVQEAQEINEWLVEIRRDFHKYPEIGLEEYRTKDKIIQYLHELGIETQTDLPHTAVVGIIRGKKPGKTVALRADMDGLPIQDQKEVAYKSQNTGRMHACGHDAHMTILLGAAKLLKEKENALKGMVKLFFQPAEENVGGAKSMIDAGVMEKPKVEAVFGLHIAPHLETGQIGLKYDHMGGSSDTVTIRIQGKSGHGAYPHTGTDAIAAAGQVITALQNIVSRNVDPVKSAVVTLGTINGGTQSNIIADEVELTGTVRALDSETRTEVLERVKKTIKKVTEAFDAKGKITITAGYPPLMNDNDMVDHVKRTGIELLGQDNVCVEKAPTLGVEDFAYFLAQAQGAFYKLGCRNHEKNMVPSLHHELFDIDEDCLVVGTALQVQNVLRFLKDES